MLLAKPDPRPPRAKAERTRTGNPRRSAAATAYRKSQQETRGGGEAAVSLDDGGGFFLWLAFPHLLHGQRCFTGGHVLVDLLHFLHKDLPVFRHLDGGHRRSQDSDVVLFQHTLLGQLHATVQSRLTAEGQENAIGTFIFYDLVEESRYDGTVREPFTAPVTENGSFNQNQRRGGVPGRRTPP